MADCVNALKRWTGKASATVVYDSTVDEFTDGGLFKKVKGKRNIAIVGFTTDGDVFGGFFSVSVTEPAVHFVDPNSFVFSFESHGRCKTPQRFFVKKEWKAANAGVLFCQNDNKGLVSFGWYFSGSFFIGNERSDSMCWNLSCVFEGLNNTTLSGKDESWHNGPYHHCVGLIAVQMS